MGVFNQIKSKTFYFRAAQRVSTGGRAVVLNINDTGVFDDSILLGVTTAQEIFKELNITDEGGYVVDTDFSYQNLTPLQKFIILANAEGYDGKDLQELVSISNQLYSSFAEIEGLKDYLDRVFKDLSEKKKLEQEDKDFFSAFKRVASDEVAKELRIKIVKQFKDSDYFNDVYPGLTGFSLDDFAQEVRKQVTVLLQGDTLVAKNPEILKPGADIRFGWAFRYSSPKGNGKAHFFSTGELIDVGTDAEGSRIVDRLEDAPYDIYQFPEQKQAVLDSSLFTNPLKFVEFELQGIDQLKYIEKDEASWFRWSKEKPFTVNDVILDYYLRFVDSVEEERRSQNQPRPLDRTLSQFRDEQTPLAAEILLDDLVNHYESLVRQGLAEQLRELLKNKRDGDFEEDEVANAIDTAQDDANEALQDLATSDLYDEKISDETVEQRQKLYKQCVLLLNLDVLSADYKNKVQAEYGQSGIHQKDYFDGRFYLLESGGDARFNQSKVINKLNLPRAQQVKAFKDMTPDIYASLQPKIRLFKVYFDQKDKRSITHEVPFAASYSQDRIDNLFKSSTSIDRGEGAGIKEFSFTFDGETPATSTKYVRASLTLFFQSFQDFVKERTVIDGDKQFTFRYLDLFVNTKFCPRSGDNSFSPLYYDPSFYRLRADVGWAMRNESDEQFQDILSARGYTAEDFNNALSLTNKTFYLNLIDHSIDIGNDGTITVKAEYIAYIEGMLDSNRMNALLDREARQAQERFVKQFEELVAQKSCNDEQRRELKNAINAFSEASADRTKQRLIRDLLCGGKIYTVKVKDSDLIDFRTKDFFTTTPRLAANNAVIAEEPQAQNLRETVEERWNYINSNFVQDPDYQNNSKIYFFYFADLIYYITDCLYDDQGNQLPEVENVKLLLSSFVIRDPFKGDQLVNIGEIPIDLETFTTWYDDHIIKKDTTNLSVIEFIKRFLFYLVAEVFNETCINQDSIKRLMFQTSNILAYKDQAQTDVFSAYRQRSTNNIPQLITNVDDLYQNGVLPLQTAVPNSRSSETSNLMNYLVIFPYYADSFHSGRGIRSLDEDNGVYHFDIGAKQGLVKTVSFSKTDIEGLRESRMFNQGNNSLLQLSSVYRCTMTMIGNTLLYPGMEFWLNPFGIGGTEFGFPQDGTGTEDAPNLSNIMGIGGYQQVLKTSSTISPGKFETTVDAHYIYSGEEGGTTNYREKIISTCEDITDIEADKDVSADACNTSIRNAQFTVSELARTGQFPDIGEQEQTQNQAVQGATAIDETEAITSTPNEILDLLDFNTSPAE